jgi:hypothetical protein
MSAGALTRPPLPAGRYFAPPGGGSSTTISNNTIYWHPFTVPSKTVISALGGVQSGGAGNFQVAIYRTNAAGLRPTGAAIAETGNISNAAVGSAAPAGGDVTLYPGILYWIAGNTNTNSLSVSGGFSGMTGMNVFNGVGRNATSEIAGADSTVRGLTSPHTFGTWPDVTTPPTYTELTNAGAPFWSLFFRVKP